MLRQRPSPCSTALRLVPAREKPAKLIEALHSLTGKLTIIMATHRLSSVGSYDELIDLGNKTAAILM